MSQKGEMGMRGNILNLDVAPAILSTKRIEFLQELYDKGLYHTMSPEDIAHAVSDLLSGIGAYRKHADNMKAHANSVAEKSNLLKQKLGVAIGLKSAAEQILIRERQKHKDTMKAKEDQVKELLARVEKQATEILNLKKKVESLGG